MTDAKHPTALISYSHDSPEHEMRVLELCNRLRSRGVDAFVDQFLSGAPSEGWPLWMERQIEQRDFTVMVCTQAYRRRFMEDEPSGVGRGVVWEARILRNLLYEDSDRHGRIVPLIFEPESRAFVPTVFRGHFYEVGDDRGFESLLRHLLREPGAQADALGALGPQGSRWSAFERPWLVPDALRTRYFTGREDLLARLRQQLVDRHRAALCGLGGVGKTQTAIEYATRHRADYPDGVFWTNAETASGLTSGFGEIAKALRLSAAATKDQEQIVRATLEWFNGTGRWLLILDNVDDRREIQPFVPQRGTGDVLITSRESVFQELGIARALDVVDLDGDEAVQFLLLRTGRDDRERAAAKDLAAELGELPLALEQAAAYISETGATFSDYLAAFRKRRLTLLEKAKELISHDTVATTWSANFAAVEAISPAAADVLRHSAFLAADGIGFEIFAEGSNVLGAPIASALAQADELAMGELLRPLVRYSLIRSDAHARTFGVHRLVQEIARTGMEETERLAFLARAASALDAAFPDVTFATWAQCDRLVTHAFAIAGWTEALDVSLEPAARTLTKAGDYLNQRGRYAEAMRLHECALAIFERLHGRDHVDVAASLNYLAYVYENLGRYEEEAALHARVLDIRERALGPDHPDVGRTLSGLANAYLFQARYPEAQQLYERAIAILERTVGPDHPNVGTGLSNLAGVHVFQARYAEAAPLYERSLRIAERALGSQDPKYGMGVHGLADVQYFLGDYAQALSLYQRALEIFENALGPDHQYVAYSVNGLANTHLKQLEHADAERLYRRALAIRERALGPDHPHVAISLTALGDLYLEQARYDDAQPLFERARAIRERGLGPDHPEVASSLVGIASIHKRQGRHAEAIALFERALQIKERTLVPEHPEIAEIRRALDEIRGAGDDATNA